MQRYYGKFSCSSLCGNDWSSGYAWVEWDYESKELKALGQECRRCKRNIYPSNIRPLRYTPQRTSQKPHDTEACEMCKKHGRDCRTLAEGSAGGDDDDDATSVFSEGSSVTTEEDRDNLTPVPSDEEDLDELLSRRVGNLRV